MEKFLDVLKLKSHGILEGNNGFHVFFYKKNNSLFESIFIKQVLKAWIT